MDFYGSPFQYNGINSAEYHLIFANVDSARYKNISGSVGHTTLFNKRNSKSHFINNIYSESAISFEIDIINPDEAIPQIDLRRIEKWLFNSVGFKRLYFYNCDGLISKTYLNCIFSNPVKIENDAGVIGYTCEVTCDTDMLWCDPTAFMFSPSAGSQTIASPISVRVDTDSKEYVYPKVTFTTGTTGGDVTFVNVTDDASRQTTFTDLPASTQIVVDGTVNRVSGDYYSNFQGRNFMRLLDGINSISVAGDVVSLTIEFQNKRYL